MVVRVSRARGGGVGVGVGRMCVVLGVLLVVLCAHVGVKAARDADFDDAFEEEDDTAAQAKAPPPKAAPKPKAPEAQQADDFEDDWDADETPKTPPQQKASSPPPPPPPKKKGATEKPKKAAATAEAASKAPEAPQAAPAGKKASRRSVGDDDDDVMPSTFEFDEEEFEGEMPKPKRVPVQGAAHAQPQAQGSSWNLGNIPGPIGMVVRLFRGRQQAANPPPPPAQLAAENAEPLPPRSYQLEMAGSVVLTFFVLTYFLGRSVNIALADAWVAQFRGLFEEQFAYVGTGKPGDKTQLLHRENASFFRFWASGRINCEYCLVTLEMQLRQNFFSRLYNVIYPAQDKVIVEVGMNEDALDPVVLAVVRCSQPERDLKADNSDIKLCEAHPAENFGLSEIFTILTDCPEVLAKGVPSFLSPEVKAAINKYQQYITSIHISDQLMTSELKQEYEIARSKGDDQNPTKVPRGRKAIVFTLRLPSKSLMGELEPVMKLCLHLVDLVAKTRMPAAARSRAITKRHQLLEAELRKWAEQEKKKTDAVKAKEVAATKKEVQKEQKKAAKKSAQLRVKNVY